MVGRSVVFVPFAAASAERIQLPRRRKATLAIYGPAREQSRDAPFIITWHVTITYKVAATTLYNTLNTCFRLSLTMRAAKTATVHRPDAVQKRIWNTSLL